METSYIYFGTFYDGHTWKNFTQMKKRVVRYGRERNATIKIGETSNIKHRKNTVDTPITLYVEFVGTKADRLFIEAYVRSLYEANCNMSHCGNDHFRCMNVNTLKGARNKFFTYVAIAFEALQSINGRQYEWACKSMG